MEVKLVKIIDWDSIGIRTKGRPKNRWRDEAIHDLKKLNLRNCIKFVKGRKVWSHLVQKPNCHVGFQYQKENKKLHLYILHWHTGDRDSSV